MIQVVQSQYIQQGFGVNTPQAQGRRFGGARLPSDLAYRVDVTAIEIKGSKNDPNKPVAHFDVVLAEPGFEGIERKLYTGIPGAVPPPGSEPKAIKSAMFLHDVWYTILLSLGYSEQQARSITVINAQVLANAPGGGSAYMFVSEEEQDVTDDVTGQPILTAAGTKQTRSSERRDFCSPDTYRKHAASQAKNRQGQQPQGQPSFNAPQQPQFGATAAPQFGAPMAPPAGAMVAGNAQSYNQPTGFTPPAPQGFGAPAAPNGTYGQPAPNAPPLMGALQTPRQ